MDESREWSVSSSCQTEVVYVPTHCISFVSYNWKIHPNAPYTALRQTTLTALPWKNLPIELARENVS